MNKNELKTLVSKYFNLVENKEDIKAETFVEATLIDGTKVTNMVDADFEVGQVLHVITEEGQHVLAPSGEHSTESGIILTVDGEGILTGVKHPEAEGEGSLEAAAEPKVEMAEEVVEVALEEEIIEEILEEETPAMDIKEAIAEVIAEIVAPEMESMKTKMAEMEEKMKEYMSSTSATEATTESRFAKIQAIKKSEPKSLGFNAKEAQKDMILKAWKNKNK